MTDSPKPKRRWFQFSLRTLLLLTAASAVLLGLWTIYVAPYRAQSRAAAALRELGAELTVEPADGPAWLRKLVGEEYFVNVTKCELHQQAVTDTDLLHLKGLTKLQNLDLSWTQVTDAGVAELQKSLPKVVIQPLPDADTWLE